MTHFRQSTRSQLPAYQYAYGNKTVSGVCLQNIFDYSPFGAALDGRTMQGDGYRYGFNGHEKVDEIKGSTNYLSWGDFGMDPRIGRRWNIDQKWQKSPGQSPYSINNDSPTQYTDPDGKFGIFGILIGAVVGAVTELGSQVVSNVVQGNPAFSKIDWADVTISAGEGALIFVSGGLSLGVKIAIKGGGAAFRSLVDYEDDQFITPGGILGKEKKSEDILTDVIGESVSIAAGALPTSDIVKDIVADQFVKNGIKSEWQFLTGIIASDLSKGLVLGFEEGIADGLYNRASKSINSDERVLDLPEVIIYTDKNRKITPKYEKKVHNHIKKNLMKQNN